jgi:hypothetical protein
MTLPHIEESGFLCNMANAMQIVVLPMALPLLLFLAKKIWCIDTKLAKVETKVDLAAHLVAQKEKQGK